MPGASYHFGTNRTTSLSVTTTLTTSETPGGPPSGNLYAIWEQSAGTFFTFTGSMVTFEGPTAENTSATATASGSIYPVAFSPSGPPTWGAPIPATATLTVNKPDSVAAHQTADLTVDQVGNMNPFYSSGTLGFIRGYLSYPAPAVS